MPNPQSQWTWAFLLPVLWPICGPSWLVGSILPVIDQGVTGFPAGFAAYVAWVDVLPKFQEMSDPEADASENEDVPNEPAEPAVVIESCLIVL